MKLAVLGSWRPKQRKEWHLRSGSEDFRRACRELGALIARMGHALVVCSDGSESADRSIVNGALEVEPRSSPDIFVVARDRPTSAFASDAVRHRGRFTYVGPRATDRRSAHEYALDEADAIIAIGGTTSTEKTSQMARSSGKRLLLVGSFGGAAEHLLIELQTSAQESERARLGIFRGEWGPPVIDAIQEWLAPGDTSSANTRLSIGALPSKEEETRAASGRRGVEAMPKTQPFAWLHLSDLHFRDRMSDRADREDMLEGLLQDAPESVQLLGQAPDCLFVTGDVAFSGQPSEYALAREYLGKLAVKLAIRREAMFIVPGNHDADRNKQDAVVAAFHQVILGRPDIMNRVLATPAEARARRLLFEKLDAFATFVEDLCPGASTIAPDQPYFVAPKLSRFPWLSIVGLNTVLKSEPGASSSGEEAPRSLVLGKYQLQEALRLARSRENLVVALMHHPLSWLQDDADLRDLFQERIDVLLTGHEHDARFRAYQSPQRLTVEHAAGSSYGGSTYTNAYALGLIHVELQTNEPPRIVSGKIVSRQWDAKALRWGPDPRLRDSGIYDWRRSDSGSPRGTRDNVQFLDSETTRERLRELQKQMQRSWHIFQAQQDQVERLHGMLERRLGARVPANLGYDDTFFQLHRELNDEERESFWLIRAMTKQLAEVNRDMLRWLERHPSHLLTTPSAALNARLGDELQALRLHLGLWLEFFDERFSRSEQRSVIYMDDLRRPGAAFPERLEHTLHEILDLDR